MTLLLFSEEIIGPFHPCKHPAPVNVAHNQNRCFGQFGHGHIDHIHFSEIDLSRAARPLDDDVVIFPGKIFVSAGDLLHEHQPVRIVFPCLTLPDRVTHQDHLGTGITRGFEQDRIHSDRRDQPAGLGLHDLGPPHFQPLPGDKAVEGHVLGFEGRNLATVLPEDTA